MKNWEKGKIRIALAVAIVCIALIGVGVYTEHYVRAAEGTTSRVQGTRTKSTIATGAVALDFELAEATNVLLRELRLHLTAAPTTASALTVTFDSGNGSAYDVQVYTVSIATGSVTSYWKQFDPPLVVDDDDELDINWSNLGSVTYGLELIWDTR